MGLEDTPCSVVCSQQKGQRCAWSTQRVHCDELHRTAQYYQGLVQ